jgi:hypothetical protein
MLISDAYREEQKALHENPNYGVASVEFAPIVTELINELEVDELLDYGAGKGRLIQAIQPNRKLQIELYEPANPDWCDPPTPRQLVTCIDVLEHIEPELLDNVLDDLKRVTKQYGFFTIHTGPAVKHLSDGRNAHLIQEDYKWWLPKIWSRFKVHSLTHTRSGFYMMVMTDGDKHVCETEAVNN